MVGSIPLGFAIVFTITPALCTISGSKSPQNSEKNVWRIEDNYDKFLDQDAAKNFKLDIDRGVFRKNERFDTNDPAAMKPTNRFIEAFKSAKDTSTVKEMGMMALKNWNTDQAMYALAKGVSNWPQYGYKRHMDIFPEWYHIFPTYFVPGKVIEETRVAVKKGTYDPSNPIVFGPDSSDRAAYFSGDMDLAVMFYNWHLNFASSAEPPEPTGARKDRGEFFFDYHNQLAFAYYMRSQAEDWVVNWSKPIKAGYRTDLSDSAGRPFSSRSPNYPPQENAYYDELVEIVRKFEDIKENNTVYINGTYSLPLLESPSTALSLLSDLLYNTTDSVNPSYYKSYMDAAREYVASLGSNPNEDAGGLVGHPMTATRDPVFYSILLQVNDIVEFYKKWFITYDLSEVAIEDVEMESMEVSRLETFFETFDVGLTRALEDSFEWTKYKARSVRLNHVPYTTTFNITNGADDQREVMITVVMFTQLWKTLSPSVKYQTVDRFVVKLKPGANIVVRKSTDSKIFSDGPYVLKLKTASKRRNMFYENKKQETTEFMGQCGIPRRLALPKGTEEGLPVTFVSMMTPYAWTEEGGTAPPGGSMQSSLCGNWRSIYGKPHSFPFDRVAYGNFSMKQMALVDTTIYHKINTFSETLSM